jgi:hypothetical protein
MGGEAATTKKKRPGRKPISGVARSEFLSTKVTPDFKEWVLAFAAAEGNDQSRLIERGLAALARARKFDKPPKR